MLIVANESNEDEAVDLLHLFFSSTNYKEDNWDEVKVRDIYRGLLKDTENSLVLLMERDGKIVGILAATCAEMLFSFERVAAELAWYVHPEYRTSKESWKMVKAFEWWAKNKVGATYTSMAHLGNEKLSKLYEKRGYSKQEEVYLRRL